MTDLLKNARKCGDKLLLLLLILLVVFTGDHSRLGWVQRDCWCAKFTGWMPRLSSNRQYQNIGAGFPLFY